MPALARGQENTPSIVNWFTTVNGTLTDMFELGFQIFDITGGLPGTQIFPAVLGTWENITTGPGHYSVGHYFAYDNAAVKGWTPGLAEPIGTHRVKWRWKVSGAAPYQEGQEDFEVLVESAGGTADTYCSVADIRAEGITVGQASDAVVLAQIEIWQSFLDRACRQWFNPRSLIVQLDGDGSDALHLGIPIVSIDYLKLNGDTEALNTDYYRVYSGRTYPDDRTNPRIKLVGPSDGRDIYTAPLWNGRMRFRKGRKNQEVKGIFGYTEADGSTPKLIKRALTKLACEKLLAPIVPPAGTGVSPPILGSILSETTDGHTIQYGDTVDMGSRKFGLSGITSDPEILDIIKLYRGPFLIAAPANWDYS